jgi:hypothetical protein
MPAGDDQVLLDAGAGEPAVTDYVRDQDRRNLSRFRHSAPSGVVSITQERFDPRAGLIEGDLESRHSQTAMKRGSPPRKDGPGQRSAPCRPQAFALSCRHDDEGKKAAHDAPMRRC